MGSKVGFSKSPVLDEDPAVDAELRRLIDEPIVARPMAAKLGGTGVDALDGTVARQGLTLHPNNSNRQHLTVRDTARYVVLRSRPRKA